MTNANPKVSVVCAWYNRADYVRDTVDSLLAQDLEDYEIIIVNDGSPDPRVREILDSYDDRRLRVIHQENTGFVGAIRRAIEESSAPFIAIQGAGDVSFKTRLRIQAQYLQENLECIGLGCRREQVTFGKDRSKTRAVIEGVSKKRIERSDFLGDENPFTHGEVMFRRSIYEQGGGYREFFRFSQDRDLWLRMSELGYFSLINDVLYQRRSFEEDGVSASVKKGITQIQLSSFAKQCAHDRDRYGVDMVDLFGCQAGFFNYGSKELAKSLSRLAIKYWYFSYNKSALMLARQSINEKFTLQGLFSWLFVLLSEKQNWLGKLSKFILSRINFNDKRIPEPLTREES